MNALLPIQRCDFTLEDFQGTSTGYHHIEFVEGYYVFHRFPAEALEVFKPNQTWFVRAEATSGIRIKFSTNSRRMLLSGKIIEGSPQTEPFIIICNDSVIAELPVRGTSGTFDQLFVFTEKEEKIIEICFPAYSKGSIRSLKLDQDADIKPLKSKGTLVSHGNSITQEGGRYEGYTDIIARGLNLDLHNAGIGGHIFQPESLPFAYVNNPSLITVAYGTNDWNRGATAENARPFLEHITAIYPAIPIVMLEPIHRYRPLDEQGKLATNRNGQSLMDYREALRNLVKGFPNVKLINYHDILPDDPSLFPDGVHPSSEGQVVFGKNLLEIIQKDMPDNL